MTLISGGFVLFGRLIAMYSKMVDSNLALLPLDVTVNERDEFVPEKTSVGRFLQLALTWAAVIGAITGTIIYYPGIMKLPEWITVGVPLCGMVIYFIIKQRIKRRRKSERLAAPVRRASRLQGRWTPD